MRNLVAGLVFVIAAAAFAGARTPADEEVHQTEAVAEPVVESTCERYGQAEEEVGPIQERARPAWLTDYSMHMGIIGVLSAIPGSLPSKEAEPVEFFEWDALMDSLSPGVRTRLQGMIREWEEAGRAAFPEWPVIRPIGVQRRSRQKYDRD